MAVSQATLIRYCRLINKFYIKIAVALIVLALTYSALQGLSGPPSISQESREYSERHKAEAEGDSCVSSVHDSVIEQDDADDKADGATKSDHVPNNFIKDKRDLNAQEGVWRASNVTARYAFFQTLVGVGGLILLGLTLDATRQAITHTGDTLKVTQRALGVADETLKEANEATAAALRAADAAENAERAWVFLSVAVEHQPDVDEAFRIVVDVKNFGKTPAIHFEGFVNFVGSDSNLLELAPSRMDVIGPDEDIKTKYVPESGNYITIDNDIINSKITCRWTFSDIWGERFVGRSSFTIRQDNEDTLKLDALEKMTVKKHDPQ